MDETWDQKGSTIELTRPAITGSGGSVHWSPHEVGTVGGLAPTRLLEGAMRRVQDSHEVLAVTHYLARHAEETGGVVLMLPEHHFIPTLRNRAGGDVFLYELMEGIEEFSDMEALAAEFDLAYGTLDGAFAFLRKLAMVNTVGWDADRDEDERDANDPELIAALRASLQHSEDPRVLNAE
jgi:hypothetical protein